MSRLHPLLLCLLVAAVLAGCGGRGDSPVGEAALVLDGEPSAVHAGIFLAVARGFPDADGVDLAIQTPREAGDAIRLLREDRAQFAVLALDELARAREDGADLVAVMALVQRPLRALLAPAGTRSVKALDGERVALGDTRGARAVLRSAERSARIRVRRVRAGGGLRALLAKDIGGAVTRFDLAAGVEGVEDLKTFRADDLGAPSYPELLLVVRRQTLTDSPALVQATVTALRRGYRETILGPEEAVGVLTERVDGIDRQVAQDQLDAVLPAFTARGPFGELDLAELDDWADWAVRFGAVRRRPDVVAMFSPGFASRGTISG